MSELQSTVNFEFDINFYDHQLFDWDIFASEPKPDGDDFFSQQSNDLHEQSHAEATDLEDAEAAQTATSDSPTTPRKGRSKSSSLDGKKTGSDSSAYMTARRRAQNRKSQQTFRSRQRQHTEALEKKMNCVLVEYEQLQEQHRLLYATYQNLQKDRKKCENCLARGPVSISNGGTSAGAICLDCELTESGDLGGDLGEEGTNSWRELDRAVCRTMGRN